MAPAEVNVTGLRRSKMPQYIELNKEMLLDALGEIEGNKLCSGSKTISIK